MASAGKPEEVSVAIAGDIHAESAAAHVVEKENVDPTVAVASSETAPVTSKRAAKKTKKSKLDVDTPSPADADAENNQNIAATIDHPYLSFLHKRIRLYKKKLEKIRALEAACANEGKKLNNQQQEVVSNKSLVEKMVVEFESLREQFIEVYLTEEAEKKTHKKEEGTPVVTEVVKMKEGEEESVEAEEETAPPPPPAVELPRDALAYVEDLLRTLHAVTLHQALGKDVPPVLDYFSKVVLGTTRPPAEVPFEDNLVESMVEATRYLTQSNQIVALEFTYKDLRMMVEQLGAHAASGSEEAKVSSVSTDQEKSTLEENSVAQAPGAEELPQINFFTDSQLEAEAAAAEEVAVTEDKVNLHDAAPEAIEPTLSEEESPEESTVDEEKPLPVAVPAAAPPKSFAAAAAAPAVEKNVWNRKPKSVTAPATGSGDDKSTQRRRSQGRSKSNSNSPRNDDGNQTIKASSNSNQSKPRRLRPQRSNDENSSSHNVNRPGSGGGGKFDDRRARSERPVRKAQPPPPQHYRETAAV